METKSENRPPSNREQPLTIFIYVLVGIISTVILMVGTHALEHTRLGQDWQFWAFGFLQGSLSNFDRRNPVVLIDIGKVPENSRELIPVLKDIVEALKTLDRRPVAIAIDVDFSPTGALSNETTEFFDTCLKRGPDDVPVYLAVGDNKSASPDQWLGLKEYKDLAAAVAINEEDTRWIPVWVQAKGEAKLKTLNNSLASEFGKLPGPTFWIARAVETDEEGSAVTRERDEVDPDALKYGERLVNYSKLEMMRDRARTVTNQQEAQSIANDSTPYDGKLVIIGDVTRSKDNFAIPGSRGCKPGSLLLASSTYTLTKEPLFEFKPKVKYAVDLFIAGVIILMVAVIRYRNPNDALWVGKQALFIYGAILLVVIAGFFLVRFARVIWPDFLFVLFALLLHRKVEHVLHSILERVGRIFQKSESPAQSSPPANGSVTNAIIFVFTMTLIVTSSVHAQQPEALCQRGIGAVALELKSDSKAKKKKETCQYCDADKDAWNDLTQADIWKQFRPGQKLRCSKGCTLVIHICTSGKRQSITYIEGKTGPGWYTVINPYRIPRNIPDRYRQTPAKKIEWSFVRPANPDPRFDPIVKTSREARADYEPTARFIERTEGARNTAATPSNPSAATSPAATPSAPATPIPTPSTIERIARVSSPNTATAAVATPAATPTTTTAAGETVAPVTAPSPTTTTTAPPATQPAGEISAGATASETAEEQKKRLKKFTSLLAKGNAERDAGNYAVAEKAYADASDLLPSDPRSWGGLGNVYFDQKNWTRAEYTYRLSAFLGTRSPEVYLALAILLINSPADAVDVSRLYEAEKYLWTAARLEPKNEKVYSLLDVVLKKRDAKPEELEDTYRRALSFNPTSVGTNLRLGTLLYRAQRKEANSYFKTAEKAARTPEELMDVATALESRNKLDKAERFARRTLKLDAGNARASLLLGLILIDRENYSAALPWLQNAINKNPDDFKPRYLSGITFLQTGDLDQAEQRFDEALDRALSEEESEATAYWLTVLGDAYAKKGSKADAVRVYEKALKHKPDDLETREKLSKTRSALNP